jgi:DnaK suppressor protein
MDDRHAGELLARERARIERALSELTLPDSADVTDPFEASDVSPELFDEQLGQARGEQLRAELEAIERAERRLADGTYGISLDSGEPIADARLEAVPWAERTTEEQARYDAAGG